MFLFIINDGGQIVILFIVDNQIEVVVMVFFFVGEIEIVIIEFLELNKIEVVVMNFFVVFDSLQEIEIIILFVLFAKDIIGEGGIEEEFDIFDILGKLDLVFINEIEVVVMVFDVNVGDVL